MIFFPGVRVLGLAFLLGAASRVAAAQPSVPPCEDVTCPGGSGYAVVLCEAEAGGNLEYHLCSGGFHFGSLIVDGCRRLTFRPHPDQGDDDNRWGTSYHLNPFLASAGDPGLGIVNEVSPSGAGIRIAVSGGVTGAPPPCGGCCPSDRRGTFAWQANLVYDAATQIVAGTGVLSVQLEDVPASDLNLYRLASNRLIDVPLQSGSTGNTGDMQYALVYFAPSSSVDDVWWPEDMLQPGEELPELACTTPDALSLVRCHVPNALSPSSYLEVGVVGELNRIDTWAAGCGHGIDPARKPSLTVAYSSESESLAFAGCFDVLQSRDYTADNVGIGALILDDHAELEMTFGVALESTPVPEPGLPLLRLVSLLSLLGVRRWRSGQRAVARQSRLRRPAPRA